MIMTEIIKKKNLIFLMAVSIFLLSCGKSDMLPVQDDQVDSTYKLPTEESISPDDFSEKELVESDSNALDTELSIETSYSVDNGFIHSHDTMRIKTHGGKYHGKKKQT